MQRQSWKVFLKAVAMGLLVLVSVAAKSESDKQYQLNVESQDIEQALRALADASGKQLLFPYDQMEALKSISISGRYTLEDALEIILKDTSLSGRLTEEGVILITLSQKKSDRGSEMNSKKKLLAGVIGFFVAGGAPGVLAQDDGGGDETWLLEEIVVTATKRVTSLQDTALSVSAISGADLSKLGITNFDQILSAVPGATVLDGGPGNSRVTFRGVATNNVAQGNDSSGADDTTSTYIDEFPLAVGDIAIKLVDMAQIEVLKGPQGTLYGQSALGGVMRFITNKPTTEAIGGEMDITFEDVADGNSGYQGQGYINIPLSDKLAVRGVFYNYDSAGFIDNVGTGNEDVNTEEVTGGRLALRWDISDRSAFNLLYLNQTSRVGSGQAVLEQSPTSTYTPVLNGFPDPSSVRSPDLENPSYQSKIDGFYDRDFEALNLKLDINYQHFDLSLMGATKRRKQFREIDAAVWFGIFDADTVALGIFAPEAEANTFEGRLVSTGDGPLEWIAGVWYEKEDGDIKVTNQVQTPRTDLVLFGFLPVVNGDFLTNQDRFRDKEELAVYGEVGYQLTDQAKLTLGYRRADLELDSGVLSATGLFGGGARASIGVPEDTQEDINTYKVHFEYRFSDDILGYALASSGYRAGGWNRTGFTQVTPASQYGTDTLWNYELGVRTSWLDNRLTANAVAYYIDWSDIQLRTWDTAAQTQKVQNAGKAENFGLETEIRYQVTDSFQLSANYAYIDASMSEDFIDQRFGTVIAAKGDMLPGSSKHAFSLFVDWQKSLASGLELLINANYRYIGSRPNIFGIGTGIEAGFSDDIPSFEVVNLSAGLSHDNGVSVSLFANNLFDERSRQFQAGIGLAGSGLEVNTMNRPRTIGLRAGYRF